MDKVIKFSPNKKLIQIGEKPEVALWYHIGNVNVDGFSEGEEVKIEWVKKANKNFLSSIIKCNSKDTPSKESPDKNADNEIDKEIKVNEEPKKEKSLHQTSSKEQFDYDIYSILDFVGSYLKHIKETDLPFETVLDYVERVYKKIKEIENK